MSAVRRNGSSVVAGALGLVVVVVLVIVLTSGGSSNGYTFNLKLRDAGGLRSGSLVTVGGVQVGTVKVTLGSDDAVIVKATLNKGKGPIGQGASAYIASVNLLGQKQLQLDKGDLKHPEPSGTTIPTKNVQESTDIDQVLDVLDPTTRARLGILVDEAGTALGGRGSDVSELLDHLPHTLSSATALLNRLVADNHTLADTVSHSDHVVDALNDNRAHLVDLVHTLSQTAVTVNAQRTNLEASLNKAPATLQTLQTLLGHLQATTVPLGPAARYISAAAPNLVTTLKAVQPFTQAADPTLLKVQQVAPALSRLAIGATPVVQKATTTIKKLHVLSTALQPIFTDTLNRSVDNLLATVQNWSRAVQFRDNLSHVFRGEATFSPQTVQSLITEIETAQSASKGSSSAQSKSKGKASSPAPAASQSPAPAAGSGSKPANPLGNTVNSILGNATNTASKATGALGSAVGNTVAAAGNNLNTTLKNILGGK